MSFQTRFSPSFSSTHLSMQCCSCTIQRAVPTFTDDKADGSVRTDDGPSALE